VTVATANRTSAFAIHIQVAARTIHLRGCLDMATTDKLLDSVDVLTQRASDSITLELQSLDFIDAAGLGAIVRARNTLAHQGSTLIVSAVSDRVAKTFAVGGLEQLLDEQQRPSGSTVVADPIEDGSATTPTRAYGRTRRAR
jgi:anti-anti-sigma factor